MAATMEEKKKKPPTSHVRVKIDLADKVTWITRHKKKVLKNSEWKFAEFIDRHIRAVIEAEYAKIEKWAEGVRKAESGGK